MVKALAGKEMAMGHTGTFLHIRLYMCCAFTRLFTEIYRQRFIKKKNSRMLTNEQFQNLLQLPESSVLDFKKDTYQFDNDTELRKTAEFVKDVICIGNTIRNETSYIILGIEEKEGSKILHGISKDMDDAVLQDKVKDKVYPRPEFQYYIISHDNNKFGVLEFPVRKYSTPLSATVRMKGLEPGKIYYRNGTANTEAMGLEVIKINDWLRSLPEIQHATNRDERVNQFLKDLTSAKPLSAIIADLYAFSREYQLQELKRFCSIELRGTESRDEIDNEILEYRTSKVLVSSLSISINPYFNGASSLVREELMKTDGVNEIKMVFSYSINKLESMQKGFKDSDKTIAVVNTSSKALFSAGVKTDFTVYIYIFPDQVNYLLANIRQKAIDLLMKY